MLTKDGACILAAVALTACGQAPREGTVEGRMPTETPSGIEKALRDVPPRLRNALQGEIACERARRITSGRRLVLDAAMVRRLTTRLSTEGPRCAPGPATPGDEAASPVGER